MMFPEVALVGDRPWTFGPLAAAMQTQLRRRPVRLRDFVQTVLGRTGNLSGGAHRDGVDALEKLQPELRRLLPCIGERHRRIIAKDHPTPRAVLDRESNFELPQA